MKSFEWKKTDKKLININVLLSINTKKFFNLQKQHKKAWIGWAPIQQLANC